MGLFSECRDLKHWDKGTVSDGRKQRRDFIHHDTVSAAGMDRIRRIGVSSSGFSRIFTYAEENKVDA